MYTAKPQGDAAPGHHRSNPQHEKGRAAAVEAHHKIDFKTGWDEDDNCNSDDQDPTANTDSLAPHPRFSEDRVFDRNCPKSFYFAVNVAGRLST